MVRGYAHALLYLQYFSLLPNHNLIPAPNAPVERLCICIHDHNSLTLTTCQPQSLTPHPILSRNPNLKTNKNQTASSLLALLDNLNLLLLSRANGTPVALARSSAYP